MLVVVMLSYVRKKGSSANIPLLPKALTSSPLSGAKTGHTVMLGFTAPRYTGEIPATCARTGQLGSDLPCGK